MEPLESFRSRNPYLNSLHAFEPLSNAKEMSSRIIPEAPQFYLLDHALDDIHG